MTGDELFWSLADELMTEDQRVAEGTIMGGRCLRVSGEFLALVNYKNSGLVLKLPRERVAEMVATDVGRPFGPGKKVFKEWVCVPEPDRATWKALLLESIAFVQPAQ